MSQSYKIILVNPPNQLNKAGSYSTPHLGLLYLSASLKQNGISAGIVDFTPHAVSPQTAADEILRHNPEYVGISVLTDRVFPSLEISEEIKRRRPDVKIIFGGPHINSTGTEVFIEIEKGKNIDFGFVKESEFTLVSFLKGEDWTKIPGLIYRDSEGKLQANKSVVPQLVMDDLAHPDLRDVVNVKGYYSPFFRGGKIMTMITSRGCPYTCKFCDVFQNMGMKYRLRSPDKIIDEILFHQEHSGVTNIVFKDSIFNLRKEHTIEFCNKLIERGVKINWMCNSRINTIDENLAKLMAKSGCKNISFGVESLDEHVLKQMNKRNQISDIHRVFKLCKDAGIATVAYMLVGCEGETYESNMRSFNNLLKINPTLAEFSISTLYPGTELYNEAVAKGQIMDKKWYYRFTNDQKNAGYLMLPDFPIEEQIKASNHSYSKFYFRPRKIAEIARHYFSYTLVKTGLNFVLMTDRHEF